METLKWYDNNATFSPYLPPIMAAGRYKFKFQFFTSKNVTVVTYESQIDIKPTRDYRAIGKNFQLYYF